MCGTEPAVTFTASALVIEYVDPSPAGTCAAPVTEHSSSSPAAAYAAPTPVSDYAASVTRAEATFEISGADGGGNAALPAEVQPVEPVVSKSTDVTERWGDVDMSESMAEMSEDAAESRSSSMP